MNIFMTGSEFQTVKDLDDRRLNKQILECKTILNVYSGARGYARHPVVEYYSKFPLWTARYAELCCIEYSYRFNRHHSLHDFFSTIIAILKDDDDLYQTPSIFYCEGSKDSQTAIRCFNNDMSIELFKRKLCLKWDDNKAKWTNRDIPDFYVKWRKDHAYAKY